MMLQRDIDVPTQSGIVACSVYAQGKRVADITSSRTSAMCASLARMVGIEALIAATTAPEWSRTAEPTQMTPG